MRLVLARGALRALRLLYDGLVFAARAQNTRNSVVCVSSPISVLVRAKLANRQMGLEHVSLGIVITLIVCIMLTVIMLSDLPVIICIMLTVMLHALGGIVSFATLVLAYRARCARTGARCGVSHQKFTNRASLPRAAAVYRRMQVVLTRWASSAGCFSSYGT